MSNLKWKLHYMVGFTVKFLEYSLESFLWSKNAEKKNATHFIYFSSSGIYLVKNLARISRVKRTRAKSYH